MRARWEPKFSEAVLQVIGEEEYNERVARVAEVLYDRFRQLDRGPSVQAKSTGVAVSADDREPPVWRSGTDG